MRDRSRNVGLVVGVGAALAVALVAWFLRGERARPVPRPFEVEESSPARSTDQLVPARVEPEAASSERTALAPEVVEEVDDPGAATLVGRVVLPVTAGTRGRMADVRVWWNYEHGVRHKGSLATRAPVTPKADGSFRLVNLPIDAPLVLWASAPFALEWGRTLAPFRAGERRTIELTLEAPVTVAGRVVDTAGAPRAGLTVRVAPSERSAAEERGGVAGRDLTTTSDELGEFRFGRLGHGLWKLELKEKDQGGSSPLFAEEVAVEGGQRLVDTRGGDVLGLEFVLEREDCLVVRLTWPDGRAARGAVCRASGGTRVKSRDDGQLELCGLTGEHELLFSDTRAGGTRGVAIARVRLPDTRELELVLHEPRTLSLTGTVRDEHGNALSGARVVARVDESSRQEVPAGDGSFEFLELAEGFWSLQPLAEGYWCDPREVLVHALAPPQDFVLRPVATIRGRVVDAEGRAVAGARIHGGNPLAESTLSDDQGCFSYGVQPGALRLLASAKGHSSSEPLELELTEGQQLGEVVLALRPACNLFARVFDDAGAPVSGAKVSIVGRSASYRTDAQGVATLQGIALGHFTLRVEAPGFLRSEQELDLAPGPARTLDVVLTRREADDGPGG